MGITIGLGYTPKIGESLFNDIRTLAENYEYGCLNGINHALPDVVNGLHVVQKFEGWNCVHFLQSPNTQDEAVAYGIQEEIDKYETERTKTKFFDFLIDLAALFKEKSTDFGIFFSLDWFPSDPVRYSWGDVNCLISILKTPGSWGSIYLKPDSRTLHESFDIPLVFRVLSD